MDRSEPSAIGSTFAPRTGESSGAAGAMCVVHVSVSVPSGTSGGGPDGPSGSTSPSTKLVLRDRLELRLPPPELHLSAPSNGFALLLPELRLRELRTAGTSRFSLPPLEPDCFSTGFNITVGSLAGGGRTQKR